MKEAFKKYMKGSPKQPSEPRDLNTIMQEYGELAGRLGQAYYRKQVLEADIAEFTSRIAKLDIEATARKAQEAKSATGETSDETQA